LLVIPKQSEFNREESDIFDDGGRNILIVFGTVVISEMKRGKLRNCPPRIKLTPD